MSQLSRRSLALAAAALFSVVGCRRAERDVAAADTSSVPGTFAMDDFRRLRWLDGRWVGLMPDGNKFFEQYRFLDDSTIVMHSFKDSTFTQATDSSSITLRGQTIANESHAARWVAVRVDSLGAEFGPERGARNHFAWSRESNDAWTATMRWMDEAGRSKSAVYSLQRVSR